MPLFLAWLFGRCKFNAANDKIRFRLVLAVNMEVDLLAAFRRIDSQRCFNKLIGRACDRHLFDPDDFAFLPRDACHCNHLPPGGSAGPIQREIIFSSLGDRNELFYTPFIDITLIGDLHQPLFHLDDSGAFPVALPPVGETFGINSLCNKVFGMNGNSGKSQKGSLKMYSFIFGFHLFV